MTRSSGYGFSNENSKMMEENMNKLVLIAMAMVVCAGVAFGQPGKAEEEIRSIHKALDAAYLKGDVAAYEAILADDYVYSNEQGKMRGRADSLEQMRKELENPNYKIQNVASNNLKVRVMGDTALVTSDWEFATMPIKYAPTEPHVDKGRYTGVYEKRNGKWMLIAEHFSEAPHDRKLMEQQILAASQNYTDAMKKRDKAAFEGLLADEYMFTNEDGKTRTKAEDIAMMTSPDTVIQSASVSDQKLRIIGNGAAVETGVYKSTGMNKGKPFDETGRYTTTWMWRGGRWQIVADHTSLVKSAAAAVAAAN
jgi:uncharacterized protein (TIGR02246 family)